jgi:hypothetical protein
MSTALSTAESFTSLNMDAHKYSKQRLRAELLEAMRIGLEKDYDGWKKTFL